nr:Ins(1,3,4,5)P4 receptor=InsP4 receptor homolog {internal fragment} [sheep, brain, Peptide Partial, 20 aa] [Ovis aries]
ASRGNSAARVFESRVPPFYY